MALFPFSNEPLLDFGTLDEQTRMRQAVEDVSGRLGHRYPLIVGGERIETGRWFISRCPDHPETVVGEVALADPSHVARALAAAEAAFPPWSRVSVRERAARLLRAGDLLRQRRREFLAWMALEVGKSFDQADGELGEAIDHFEWNARQVFQWAEGKAIQPLTTELNEYRYRPLGVGVVISPWNFPTTLPLGMVVAAVAAGNTVVLKPAEESSVLAYHLVEILLEAGIPPGVVNLVTGTGSEVGPALVEDPRVRFVAFVGSRRVGTEIAQRAAIPTTGQRALRRVMTEMGGKNATIVTEHAEVPWAAAEIVRAALGFQGQKCSATSRVITLPGIHDALVDAMRAEMEATVERRGRAVDNAPFGALINEAVRAKVESYTEQASRDGRVVLMGSRDQDLGYTLTPTLVDGVAPGSPLAQDEIFGPVLAVIPARTLEEATGFANGVEYALTGAAFTRDAAELDYLRDNFYVGNLYLNRSSTGAMAGVHPFGGYKWSGTGPKVGGPDYLGFFLEAQVVTERVRYPGASAGTP